MSTKKEVVIIVAEDDEGHASLIVKNLQRAGIANEIICFKNGQETPPPVKTRPRADQDSCNHDYHNR